MRIGEPDRKKSLLPDEDSVSGKPWLCLPQLSQLPFPLYTSVLLLLPWGDLLAVIADPEWNFLLIPNKPIFVGEISDSLFISNYDWFACLESQFARTSPQRSSALSEKTQQ